MKAISFSLFVSLVFLFAFSACRDIREEPLLSQHDYRHGIFVVNEGGFNGSGSISWHDPATGTTEADIYALENNGADLGQFAQSLAFHNGKGYICVNGANRVVVVDATTFHYIDTIRGITSPRYFLPIDDRYALISQWNTAADKALAKVDLQTNQVVEYLPCGSGPEKMLRLNADEILVANSGGFGTDSTVSRVNLNTGQEVERYVAGDQIPCCLARPAFGSGQPVVLCKGYFGDANSQGWLGDFGPNTIAYTVDKYADDLVASPDAGRLYFAGAGAVFALTASGVQQLFDQATYGLACHPVTGDLYCGTPDFASNGQVKVYSPAGALLDSFPVGIGPGEIVIVP